MPPRRRPPAPSASAAASTSKPAVARPSKLAKENNITAQEEAEIREAFSLFAEPLDDSENEPDLVIPISDVRRALIALGLPPTSPAQLAAFTAALDPDNEGFATYPAFVSICALQLHARKADQSEDAHRAELDEAFALFTGTGTGTGTGTDTAGPEGGERVITLGMLRRVAQVGGGKGKMKGGEGVVTDELLRDMILEANGGAGVGRGVRKEEFDGVMRRAGVWR
ncbi:hypothetical protein BT67DRAFT_415751 [Trichocladium antarcticum]|uniref:Calmodulin n=1 Tax=Trichocladium antarcticum TaxID=1450529 RepID=A0AAN6US44_9PEZI|nr:hypothetical protein BT67DRAFT_415751 [Trichocladium antarcticum]